MNIFTGRISRPIVKHRKEQISRRSCLTERLRNAVRKINTHIRPLPRTSDKESCGLRRRKYWPTTKHFTADDRGRTCDANSRPRWAGRSCLADWFWTPFNNEFTVVNQFTIFENGNHKRPDFLLFVNGIPLVVLSLKTPRMKNTTVYSAYKQIETYKAIIPHCLPITVLP